MDIYTSMSDEELERVIIERVCKDSCDEAVVRERLAVWRRLDKTEAKDAREALKVITEYLTSCLNKSSFTKNDLAILVNHFKLVKRGIRVV